MAGLEISSVGRELLSNQVTATDHNNVSVESALLTNSSVASSEHDSSNTNPARALSSGLDSNGASGSITPGSTSILKKILPNEKRKLGHRRVDEHGQVTFKKIETSQICGSLQLGINSSVGRLSSKPERDVLMQDFTMLEKTNFPAAGSQTTPAHKFDDFKFKAYAPVAFRYFRDLFGISPDDYLLSVCHEELIELSNPGASGSVFYKTKDDRFIIKTVQQKESFFLRKLLPKYFMNLHQNPDTLLPKFYGLYCYICGVNRVRVVVMNNLLPSKIPINIKFDLKGSSYKRKANKYERSKSCPTYKDLDFLELNPQGIYLEPETYESLIKTIKRDCMVLESFNIMDYSLLIGIHDFEKKSPDSIELPAIDSASDQQPQPSGSSGEEPTEQCEDTMDGDGTAHKIVQMANAQISAKARDEDDEEEETEFQTPPTELESIQLEMLNKEDNFFQDTEDLFNSNVCTYLPPDVITGRTAKGNHLLLFCGIIDILQSYELNKKLEHSFKSILTDGKAISVTRPSFYAKRFQDFLANQVFKKQPSLLQPKFPNHPMMPNNFNFMKRKMNMPPLNWTLNNLTNSQIFNHSLMDYSTETNTLDNQSIYSYKSSIRSAPIYNPKFNRVLQDELAQRVNYLNLNRTITRNKLASSGLHYISSLGSTGDDALSHTNGSIQSDRASASRIAKTYRGMPCNVRQLSELQEIDVESKAHTK